MSDGDAPNAIPAEMRIPVGEAVLRLQSRLTAGLETYEYNIRFYEYNPNDNTVILSILQCPYEILETLGETGPAENQLEIAESPSSPLSEPPSSSSSTIYEEGNGNDENIADQPRVTNQSVLNAATSSSQGILQGSASQHDDQSSREGPQDAVLDGSATEIRQKQFNDDQKSSVPAGRPRRKQAVRRDFRHKDHGEVKSIGLDPMDEKNKIEQRLRGSSKRKAPDFYMPEAPPAKRTAKSKVKEPAKAAVRPPPKRPVKRPTKRASKQTAIPKVKQVAAEAGSSSRSTVIGIARSRESSIASSASSNIPVANRRQKDNNRVPRDKGKAPEYLRTRAASSGNEDGRGTQNEVPDDQDESQMQSEQPREPGQSNDVNRGKKSKSSSGKNAESTEKSQQSRKRRRGSISVTNTAADQAELPAINRDVAPSSRSVDDASQETRGRPKSDHGSHKRRLSENSRHP